MSVNHLVHAAESLIAFGIQQSMPDTLQPGEDGAQWSTAPTAFPSRPLSVVLAATRGQFSAAPHAAHPTLAAHLDMAQQTLTAGGSIPWGTLVPLIMQLLQTLLAAKGA